MSKLSYVDGGIGLPQNRKLELVKAIAESYPDKQMFRLFVEAQFGADKVFELNWSGAVDNAVASLVEDCVQQKQLAKLVEALTASGGYKFTLISSNLLGQGILVPAEEAPASKFIDVGVRLPEDIQTMLSGEFVMLFRTSPALKAFADKALPGIGDTIDWNQQIALTSTALLTTCASAKKLGLLLEKVTDEYPSGHQVGMLLAFLVMHGVLKTNGGVSVNMN